MTVAAWYTEYIPSAKPNHYVFAGSCDNSELKCRGLGEWYAGVANKSIPTTITNVFDANFILIWLHCEMLVMRILRMRAKLIYYLIYLIYFFHHKLLDGFHLFYICWMISFDLFDFELMADEHCEVWLAFRGSQFFRFQIMFLSLPFLFIVLEIFPCFQFFLFQMMFLILPFLFLVLIVFSCFRLFHFQMIFLV